MPTLARKVYSTVPFSKERGTFLFLKDKAIFLFLKDKAIFQKCIDISKKIAYNNKATLVSSKKKHFSHFFIGYAQGIV